MNKALFAGCVITALLISLQARAQMDAGMDQGMTEQEAGDVSQNPGALSDGAKIFADRCASCHPDGGNVIVPDLPLKGSRVLGNYRTFLAFIRHPKMPDGSQGAMPPFSKSLITDRQARQLYHYITFGEGPAAQGGYGMGPGMMRGYGMMRGMMGGYGMGPGMMRGYGMGRGMMGGYGMGPGYYTYSPECQKFYNETAALRRELNNKRFEYFEAIRNPKTTGDVAEKIEKEIRDLEEKIYARAPLGCRW
ncbi:MAG: c-type cytochrome [Nitrospiraceae bacterium]|nr:c-type cytochrome [Nitrospiraceae bacterium]